jgi:polysaccharide biosynthesis protein PslH
MKVLFIAPSFPLPAHSGGAIATLETLKSIHSLCDLHLLVPPPESDRSNQESLLRSLLPDIVVDFYTSREAQPTRLEMYTTAAKSTLKKQSYWSSIWINPSLRAEVKRLTAQHHFDLIHCDWLQPAVSLRGLDLPLLIRTLDVHFVGMRDWAESLPPGDKLRKSFWRKQADRFRGFEAETLNGATTVITLSAEDEAVLRIEGVSNIVTIPPPREVEPEATSIVREKTCTALFMGRLDMPVNREAFFLFANEVWPHLKPEAHARVKTVFAGGFPDEQVRHRAVECSIEIHAPLSDTEARQLFADADIFLSPVVSGTGIKIKTLDAMAHGKPIIGFPGAFRGVPVDHGVHALIATSAKEFAQLFEGLIRDPVRQREIGLAAREFVSLNFDPGTLAKRLLEVYSQTAESYSGRVKQRA